MGTIGIRFRVEGKACSPTWAESYKMLKTINADTIVANAMANIDAEYADLVAEASLVTL